MDVISTQMRSAIENGSWIRRMFEAGIQLKQQYGEDAVCDFSLGNPDLTPPPAVGVALRAFAEHVDEPFSLGYMPNAGFGWAREKLSAAAYTQVDKAEDNVELCRKINAGAVENLARAAASCGARMIHVSTDYVFNGRGYRPYTEDMTPEPQSVYGSTKLEGEQALQSLCPQSVIIRTAWLYSPYGNNFVKTMMRLGTERDELSVVADQIGTPTCAADLARAILAVLTAETFVPGIYHFSDEGACSWYDFTVAIHRLARISCRVNPIRSDEYPSRAHRPFYSVLDKSKIKQTYGITIPHWYESLSHCIEILQETH